MYPEKGPRMALFGGTFTKMHIFGPKICSKNAAMLEKSARFSVTAPPRTTIFRYRLGPCATQAPTTPPPGGGGAGFGQKWGRGGPTQALPPPMLSALGFTLVAHAMS